MAPCTVNERQPLMSQPVGGETPRLLDIENRQQQQNPMAFFEDEFGNHKSSNNHQEDMGFFPYLIRLWLDSIRCLCSCTWMTAEESKNDDKNMDKKKVKGSGPEDTSSSFTSTAIQFIKYIISLTLLGLCIYSIIAGIFAKETPVAISTNSPFTALFTMWILILWLGVLEGGQGSLVGLQPIDKSLYSNSHPMAYECATIAHKGDNLNRFIVGRQFLVVLVVFCLNLCCTAVEDAIVPGVPGSIVTILLSSGLAVMIITVIVGQLAAEVNATNCMLDFINSPVTLVTTYICLMIESSGLLHSVYLVQCFFRLFTKEDDDEDEPRSSSSSSSSSRHPTFQGFMYWIRVLFSVCLLGYAMVVTIAALHDDKTTMCENLPDVPTLAIFIFLICFLGILEAMQIALFAVVNLSKEDLVPFPAAVANSELVFSGDNFKAFLIGRQICVTTCMFLLARITTTNVDTSHEHLGPGLPEDDTDNVMNVSATIQNFFNTGLPGALITTIVASLWWRIIAASFPIAFMAANPMVYITIRVCLLLEASGVFSAAWLLGDFIKYLMGFQLDETYIGSFGQRGDDDDKDSPDSTRTLTLEEEEAMEEARAGGGYGATIH